MDYSTKVWIWSSVIIFIIIIIASYLTKNKKEGYGQVLGALSPYRVQLSECLRECQYENRMNKLDTGIFVCNEYCYDKIEKMAKAKIEPPPLNTYREKCVDACSANDYSMIPYFQRFQAFRECLGRCQGNANVRMWCRQNICSQSPDARCEEKCMDVYTPRGNEFFMQWKI